MIKMCFFDKRDNSMIVNAFKQLLNRRERENFSRVSRKWVHSKKICCTVSESPQKAQDGGLAYDIIIILSYYV